MGTFAARITELQELVGKGRISGSVEVDQVYAHYQHERMDLRHPRGGGPGYLRNPLFQRAREFIQRVGSRFDDGRVGMDEAMGWAMEQLCVEVMVNAPVEFSDLKFSGHPKVIDDGQTMYDRAPIIARLSDEQIKAKNRQRRWGV